MSETAATAPSVIQSLRATAREAHAAAAKELSETRAKRDALNKKIVELVTTEAELRRVVGALTRTPRKTKAAKS